MNLTLTVTVNFEVDDADVENKQAVGLIRNEARQFTRDLPELLADNQGIYISNVDSTVTVERDES